MIKKNVFFLIYFFNHPHSSLLHSKSSINSFAPINAERMIVEKRLEKRAKNVIKQMALRIVLLILSLTS